ncbi:MAG: hypothetical protein HGA25_04290, partial [Clostridiales bacterium]|nr:hypothetical protein [Clostridiales bacterium]
LLLPLSGGLFNALLGRRLPRRMVETVACGAIWGSFAFSLLAFPAYKLTGFLLLYLLRIRKVKKVSPGLLLLRVFALGEDSKNLFERILKHWRYAGSIQMISGPDLATTTVEPHEIVSFVSGRMKDSFCESEESINQNISKIDNLPDLDGTHRVNEFFCRDNNWKYVLQQLVVHSDIVLMDLRKFSDQFKGCKYEIEALVNLVPLNRIVFVIDDETVIPFTQKVFAGAFHLAGKNSVNKAIPLPAITLYKIDKKMFWITVLVFICHLPVTVNEARQGAYQFGVSPFFSIAAATRIAS